MEILIAEGEKLTYIHEHLLVVHGEITTVQ
jgi:hypothetical protein